MKKTMAIFGLAMTLSLASGMTALAAWEQKDGKWYYYDGQGDMLKDTWVGNYYVGADGAMLTDTLTPEGYWLGENGLASEDKRVYGDCVFEPTSYQKSGNGFLITGNICSSGYASEEYLRSLKVGDVILRPADEEYAGAAVFDTRSVVTEIRDDPYYYYDANGEYWEAGRTVCTKSTAPPDDDFGDQYYTFRSDSMVWWQESSMDAPLYRIIEKDVVLVFDEGSEFVPVQEDWDYIPRSMSAFLEKDWRRYVEVKVTNGYITQAMDLMYNYVG